MTQVPATQADMQFANTGLEDFSTSDAVLPRIKILHQEGLWGDNLTGMKIERLRFIALGLVKQRVLFHHNVEDDDVPMCKSSDFNLGFPNPEAPAKKSFPWELAGFNPNDFPADAEGNRQLPCSGCQLKEWGSNPTNENPYCSEQWTLPIYYDTSHDESGDWSPAILTLQKSSIKPIRTYFTSFAQSNKPPFLSIGVGTLKTSQRGSVVYSVPSFTKVAESPRERWMEFSEQFADMKRFLTRPPLREAVDDGSTSTNNTYTGPPQQQAPAPAAEAQSPQPTQDPWQPTAAAQPQEPPAQPAPAQPVAPPQPVQPSQPAQPAQPPAQPQAQTPPPPAGQELPF